MEIGACKRAQIVALVNSGLTQRDVGARVGVSQQVVSLTMKKFRSTGSYDSAPRSGRPRVTTKTTDRTIKRVVKANPSASSLSIAAELPTPVSARTVRRRLSKEMGLRACRPARKPLLSKKNICDRLAFCHKYKHFTKEMWEAILWSDETNIKLFEGAPKYVRRPVGQRFLSKYCSPTVKHAPYWMIWGSFSAKGRGNLYFLPKNCTMNASQYLEVLTDRLTPMMSIHRCTKFQHDGAPCHRSQRVKSWLQQEGVDVLGPWPGQSPDLNPIENLWKVLKAKVNEQKPASMTELKDTIQRVWCTNISSDLCKNLVHSMPDRIAAVIKNKGRHTKY